MPNSLTEVKSDRDSAPRGYLRTQQKITEIRRISARVDKWKGESNKVPHYQMRPPWRIWGVARISHVTPALEDLGEAGLVKNVERTFFARVIQADIYTHRRDALKTILGVKPDLHVQAPI